MNGGTASLSRPVPEYLAFGDISIDVAVRAHHLPQPDDKQWVELIGEYPGGMAANAASAFAALGGSAGVIASVGTDDYGKQALDDLVGRGVDISLVRVVEGRTFWTLALLTPDGEKSLVQFQTPAFAANLDSFQFSILDGTRFVHAIPEHGNSTLHLLSEARQRGKVTSLDIEESMLNDIDLERLLAVTDILFISRTAACQFDPSPRNAAMRLSALGVGTVVVTLGAEGCFLLDRSQQEFTLPGHRVESLDTTGAGDCFAGAFAFGKLRNWTEQECAELANLMAAISTTAYGSRGAIHTGSELAERAKNLGFAWGSRLK